MFWDFQVKVIVSDLQNKPRAQGLPPRCVECTCKAVTSSYNRYDIQYPYGKDILSGKKPFLPQ